MKITASAQEYKSGLFEKPERALILFLDVVSEMKRDREDTTSLNRSVDIAFEGLAMVPSTKRAEALLWLREMSSLGVRGQDA